MRVLVAVASKHQSTREIAQVITEELRLARLTVDVLDAGAVDDLSAYDAVVLGSAIYAGNWLPDAKRFAEHGRPRLAQLPVWLFSSGPLGAENPQPKVDTVALAAPLGGVVPRDHQVFTGKLDFDELGVAERLIAKAVRAPEGDFRDWDAIRAWARGIAAELLPEATHP
jgi:menaquinone-dependent protoporphyrinogen oxidase